MTGHTDDVPEFILEKLTTYDDDQLGAISKHVHGRSKVPPDDLPEDIVSVLALQDDETVAAVAETVDRMRESDRGSVGLTGYEAMAQEIIDYAREEIGDELALAMARDVKYLRIDEEGGVESILGSEQIVVEHLADEYIGYLGPTAKNAFSNIADEYDVETPVNLNRNPFG